MTTLTQAQIDALTHDVHARDTSDGATCYVTEIDHAGHDAECGDCPDCDEQLADLRESLPAGWAAEWTGHGNGTAHEVRIDWAVRSYCAWIEGGGGETIITADSLEEAVEDATHWAAGGDYDHPGSITLYVIPLDGDGDGIEGYLRVETVEVGGGEDASIDE